tara:strand:- start:214 stop:873 length:660 start_codon:yes stop_codon:yes gene_type:complete
MRSEIKIPLNEKFNLYFNQWKDYENKVLKVYNDRLVNSIYYDDENYCTAQDNLAGVSNRRKYRIRWYGSEFNDFIYEIKIKQNNLGEKISLKSNQSLNKIQNLFSFNNDFLKKEKNKFFLNYVNNFNLIPKMKIKYLRSYFIYKNKIRITYDRNINYELLKNSSLAKDYTYDFMSVIELKFNPNDNLLALELIKNSKLVPKRFSKYLRGLYLLGVANYL